jgi:dCMP deaminase
MKYKFMKYFMKVAEETAQLSYAKRLQVGCVIVRDNRILSIGYNGTPAGWDNCCEGSDGLTKSEVIHAEANAILKLAAATESSVGADLFLTHAPCVSCAKLIYQAKIKSVIYLHKYGSEDGVEFLNKAHVPVIYYGGLHDTSGVDI